MDVGAAALTRTARFPLRIGLARDPTRIILWLGMRLAIAEIALVVGLQTPGSIGLAVTIAGGVVLVYVILLALHVLSLRMEIHPGEVRLASLLVRRRYPLQDGEVTRLRIEPRRGLFGTQLGGFGIEIGLGRAPSKESVDVVRLAPVPSMILIPSTMRRLAVAPSSERTLLLALKAAAEGAGPETAMNATQAPASRSSR